MLAYSVVEAALAKINHVPEASLGAFRGRISNLKRIGLVASSGGRGKKILYDMTDVWKLAFYIELTQSGIDPTAMKDYFSNATADIITAFNRVYLADADIYYGFGLNIMTGSFYYGEKLTKENIDIVGAIAGSEFDARDLSVEKINNQLRSRRVILLNISQLRRDLDRALASEARAAS